MLEFLLILSALTLYFAPVLVAAWRRHPKLASIGGLNAALGFTVVGWISALMWALGLRLTLVRSPSVRVHLSTLRLLAATGLVVGVAAVATIGVERLEGRSIALPILPKAAAATAPTTEIPAQWQYTTSSDGRTMRLLSRNRLPLPPPYKSGPAMLDVTRGPEGYAVRLEVDGDMACAYAPTASALMVSFDGAAPRAFACASAPDDPGKLLFDGAHSTAYLADPVGFLARLRNARHISIKSDFAGQPAAQEMAFDLPPGDPVAGIAQAVTQVEQEPAATTPASAAPEDVPIADVVIDAPPAAVQDAHPRKAAVTPVAARHTSGSDDPHPSHSPAAHSRHDDAEAFPFYDGYSASSRPRD